MSKSIRRKSKQSQISDVKSWNAGLELSFMRDRMLEIMRDSAYQPIMAGDTSATLYKAVKEIDKALSGMQNTWAVNHPKWTLLNYEQRAKLRATMEWGAVRYSGLIKFSEAAISKIINEERP